MLFRSLYMKENDDEKILIDPNKLSEDGTTAMSNYFISHDGRKVDYAISKHGSDWQEILVRDVDAGEDLSDHIKQVKFINVACLHVIICYCIILFLVYVFGCV